jgi:hypothetical protein
MSDLSEPFKLHESFRSTGDPFPENPFAQDDPRHEVWREATHTAEVEAARLNSEILAWKASTPEDQVDRTLALFLGKFDIWASRHSYVLWSDAAIHEYIQWLVDFAESGIRAAVTSCPAPISHQVLTAELRVHFLQRVEYWKSQALGIRTGIASRSKNGNRPQTQPTTALNPEIAKRRAIVKQNPTLSAQGICHLFDEAHIPLTKSMQEAGTWSKAYKSDIHRHAIESLISRDKKAPFG